MFNFSQKRVPVPVTELITAENVTGTDTTLAAQLSYVPLAGSMELRLNGLDQEEGAGRDFTVGGNGKQITWLAATGTAVDMQAGIDRVVAKYWR